MSVFAPKLPSPSELNFCERDAVLYGRNLVLNDLAEHPDRETDYYVRAAVFHVYAAAAYDSTQRDLLASLATHPTTSSLAELSPELFEDHLYSTLRRLSDVRFYWPAQCYWLMCTALGMAQAADALFRADGDARGHAPSSLEAFLLDGFYIPPAAKGDANLEAMSPISRPRARNEEHMQLQVSGSFAERPLIAPPGNGMPQSSAPDNYAVADPDLSGDELNADTSTCSELIEDWLGSKGALSRAERSRRGASARHLITALSLTDSSLCGAHVGLCSGAGGEAGREHQKSVSGRVRKEQCPRNALHSAPHRGSLGGGSWRSNVGTRANAGPRRRQNDATTLRSLFAGLFEARRGRDRERENQRMSFSVGRIPILKDVDADRAAAFWNYVEKRGENDCWIWRGGKSGDGYGVFAIRRYARVSTHRISFALANGVEPGTGHVCHRCDTPLCCNPRHLFLGTAKINAVDKVKKGRARGRFSVEGSMGT